jgi:hypothetical protein
MHPSKERTPMYVIEKAPVPLLQRFKAAWCQLTKRSDTRVRPSKYPFSKMKVGDSFFVQKKRNSGRCRITYAWKYAKRHPGLKFSVRQVSGGCRVLRVA